MDKRQSEIASFARDAISRVPPLAGVSLTVDEKGIYQTETNGEAWWHVPIIPTPAPRRLYPLYEVFTEIEEVLREERGMDILLFAGDFESAEPTEPALT